MRFVRSSRLSLAALFGVAPSQAALTFHLTFTTEAQNHFSQEERNLFNEGLQFWDNLIINHRDGVSRSWTLNVGIVNIPSGTGGTLLGGARVSGETTTEVVPGAHTSSGRFVISTGGEAVFNVHPDAGPLRASTIRHEIGHALGIGALWVANEIYIEGSGQFTGPSTLAAYKAEFDSGATFVPVELDGGGGTANGHWNMTPNDPNDPHLADRSPAPTDNSGRSLSDELMTGFRTGTPWLSETTIASLYDIGFNVVPEPDTSILCGVGLLLLIVRRRR